MVLGGRTVERVGLWTVVLAMEETTMLTTKWKVPFSKMGWESTFFSLLIRRKWGEG